MKIQTLDDYETYHQQGKLLQLSPHTIDRAVIFAAAIASGDVAVPISQKECENALMHSYLLSLLDLMIQHPHFVATSLKWAAQQGVTLSEDRDVSIFMVPLHQLAK